MSTARRPAPGDGPLFGSGSRFAPEAIAPHLRAREAARLETLLATIERQKVEEGWDNPPLRAGLAALEPPDRDRLLLAPDFRHWLSRLLWAFDPRARPDAALPVQVQAAWNQLAIPWLRCPASGQGTLWLLVFGGGQVPFPGSGLELAARVEGRRVQLRLLGEMLRLDAENGVNLVSVTRQELLAAAAGGPPPPGFRAARRLAGTEIEIVGGGASDADSAAPDEAVRQLAVAWPAGRALLGGLVRRLQLDPDPELNSKTESELPGVVILGRRRTDPQGIAELLAHEAAHCLVYEVALLAPILPAPHEIRRSPFSREGRRPAYMVLHATVSFLAQAIAALRLAGRLGDARAASRERDAELARLDVGEREIHAHLAAHHASPHPFVDALSGELALLRAAIGQ